ncbi:MAG: 2-hydroxyacyl-CoA dehydratase [Firmicutes bacterium]|nr:2-hydroxyacyl-CoA dehydratase [Bacillota bacterium]
MRSKIYYICKYAPLELCEGYGFETEKLDPAPSAFDCAESCMHPNICGYGKAVVEEVNAKGIKALLLTDCCDVCRRIYDVLKAKGDMDFIFLMNLPHKSGDADAALLESELLRLKIDLARYALKMGEASFSGERALAFIKEQNEKGRAQIVKGPHVSLTGAHGGSVLKKLLDERLSVPVQDDTCSGRRIVEYNADRFDLNLYARALMTQSPVCRRMQFESDDNPVARGLEPDTLGTICHTMKFCDYYSFQYKTLRERIGDKPLLKIETDSTPQSSGQLKTRIDAFGETLGIPKAMTKEKYYRYTAGIDSGSASTDAVILDADKNIVGFSILPTGAGAMHGAEKALSLALENAGLRKEDIDKIVTTGYGRDTVGLSDLSVTEISCHAKGAHFLCPTARTVIDIGGQDSKVIRLDDNGNVVNFVMNDKCAAGTGRFLEMMARTLELSLPEMSELGLKWKKDVAISSMCTVFAESEVVSLVAQNTAPEDIIHGLNEAIAGKTAGLAARLGKADGDIVMTGGVSQNRGVVDSLEKKLGVKLVIPKEAQICGALGAALYAMEE